jgi:hypothetical protein
MKPAAVAADAAAAGARVAAAAGAAVASLRDLRTVRPFPEPVWRLGSVSVFVDVRGGWVHPKLGTAE